MRLRSDIMSHPGDAAQFGPTNTTGVLYADGAKAASRIMNI